MGTQSKGVKTSRLSEERAKQTLMAAYTGNRKGRRAALATLRRDSAAKRKQAANELRKLRKLSPEEIDKLYKEQTS